MEYTQYTVSVVLKHNGKVWMSQRIQTPNFHGMWQFAGGKLEEKENPIDGAVRELKEETALTIDFNRLRYYDSILKDPTTSICYVYAIDLNDDEIPARTENTMTDWVLMDYDEALTKDLMPGLREVINRLKKEKNENV